MQLVPGIENKDVTDDQRKCFQWGMFYGCILGIPLGSLILIAIAMVLVIYG